MNEEIKEILDEISEKIIPNEHWNKVKDYITNLQKTNKNHSKKLIELGDKIDQLTNNWNELEEWLKSYIALFDNPDTLEEQTLEDLKEVLDKMKEIKENNNDIS